MGRFRAKNKRRTKTHKQNFRGIVPGFSCNFVYVFLPHKEWLQETQKHILDTHSVTGQSPKFVYVYAFFFPLFWFSLHFSFFGFPCFLSVLSPSFPRIWEIPQREEPLRFRGGFLASFPLQQKARVGFSQESKLFIRYATALSPNALLGLQR